MVNMLLTARSRSASFEGSGRTRTTYDFIVIGASPSGSVIANRLTSDPKTSVLVIEAGVPDNFLTDIPAFNAYWVLSGYNWGFLTEPNPEACWGMEGGICPWPAGKGAGGGSIVNGMIYTRGNHRDYDKWAEEGNPGWSYKEVLPYFLRSENVLIKELRNSKYHGKNGSLFVSYPPFRTPLLRAFMKVGKRFGFKAVDYNNPNSHLGFAQLQSTMRNGRRVNAASAFLKPSLSRRNFQIELSSRVTRVLIDESSHKAYGVEYAKNGRTMTVYATKEVIISAGAFNSPQILMLSGIGHADHLAEMGIKVLQNLPVGDNLQEHIGMHGLVFTLDKPVSINPIRIMKNIPTHLMSYFGSYNGPLTASGCEAVAYYKSKYSNASGDEPDLEMTLISSGLNTDNGLYLRKTFGIGDEIYDSVYRAYDGQDAFGIWPMLLHPESLGYVRLRNNNPLSKVRIYNNFLHARKDIDVLVEGLKASVKLGNSPEFRKYGAKLISVPFPNCKHLKFGSDQYWECTIRTVTAQWHHQCCTCKMGSVVDSRLRVFGIKGLRVADASIMPRIPGSHIQASAYMIGEKASDFIREDWGIPIHS